MLAEPELYRKEAEKAKRLAAASITPELRQQWAKLAEAYTRLAEAAEDLAKGEDREGGWRRFTFPTLLRVREPPRGSLRRLNRASPNRIANGENPRVWRNAFHIKKLDGDERSHQRTSLDAPPCLSGK